MRDKRILIVSFVVLSALLSASALAEAGRSLEDIVSGIMKAQNATALGRIDCGKVPGAAFEELGDAVMEKMIGDHQLHEQMDAMMGGEGSESLAQMHAAMGRNWMGCGGGFQGMMGYGGMMSGMMRMMGYYYSPSYYSNLDSSFAMSVLGWTLFFISAGIFLALYLAGRIVFKKGRVKR